VQREVWVRDEGRCAYVAANGRRCTERVFLEFHHRDPYAIGGEATVENISLRCRAHNVYEAELLFGPWTERSEETELAPGRDEVGNLVRQTEACQDAHSGERRRRRAALKLWGSREPEKLGRPP